MTVGGIVVDCKKIRTKSGSQMMFATLDDVEGQVEMLVFKADEAESAAVIQPDAIVLVRGRLDHKDRGETKLVVQEAQRFEPDAAEIAKAAQAGAGRDPAGPFEVPIDVGQLSDELCRGTEGGARTPQGRRRGPPRRWSASEALQGRREIPGEAVRDAAHRAGPCI